MLCFAKYNDNFGQYFEQKFSAYCTKSPNFQTFIMVTAIEKQEIQILFINYGFQKRIIMIYYFI